MIPDFSTSQLRITHGCLKFTPMFGARYSPRSVSTYGLCGALPRIGLSALPIREPSSCTASTTTPSSGPHGPVKPERSNSSMTTVAFLSGNASPGGCGSPGSHICTVMSKPLSCICCWTNFQTVSMRPLISIQALPSLNGLIGTTQIGVCSTCRMSISDIDDVCRSS